MALVHQYAHTVALESCVSCMDYPVICFLIKILAKLQNKQNLTTM